MFKLLIATATLVFASFAQADALLPEDTIRLYKLSTPTINVSKFECPPNMLCAASLTSVKLHYTLSGCVDSMAPLTYFVAQAADSINTTVYVSAKAYANKNSQRVRCMRAPVGTVEIVLPGVMEAKDVTIVDLDQEADAVTR